MKILKQDLDTRLKFLYPQIISVEGGTAWKSREDITKSRPAYLIIRSKWEYRGIIFKLASIWIESNSDSYLPYTEEMLNKAIKEFPFEYEKKIKILENWCESLEGQKVILQMIFENKRKEDQYLQLQNNLNSDSPVKIPLKGILAQH
jgi:hypothetical protein